MQRKRVSGGFLITCYDVNHELHGKLIRNISYSTTNNMAMQGSNEAGELLQFKFADWKLMRFIPDAVMPEETNASPAPTE